MVGSSNFLVPNGTFIVELVAFVIVVAVLGRYILPSINRIVEQRQAAISEGLAAAEEAKRKAAEAEQEYKRVISEARSQARDVVEEANKQAEQLRADKRQQADREYEQKVAQATADIEAQARRASEELRRQAADLAITVAERVIGEGLDPQSQQALIDRTIADVRSQAGSAEVSA